ncbi:M16 family metallopeptidase [Actinoplanes sp. NPDC051859]|uniref:M16 family metallopeptidase n=1 Tax=Actinoplanes sp. NPDC051859 TaxID=3363909 RepID=UPI0037954E42
MIKQLELDGVPTLLAPTAGPMHAGLAFRVGQADETLARKGITHLVEHLALHSIGVADYHYNGATGTEYTYFHMQGSAEKITGFLTGVCAALRSLPMARLETEKEILRTEQSSRPGSVVEPLLLWRHGAQDFGLPAYPEWGLPALTADDVQEWVARYFTRDNAALWIAGDEVPAGLRLDLPSGVRRQAPRASSTLPETPAWFSGSSSVVAWDAVVPHSAGAAVFADVLERRMFLQLRQEAGLSYSAYTDYDRRSSDRAVITAVADALPEKQGAVLGGFVDLLAALRVGRIDEAEVASVINQATESLLEADAQGARLPGQVFNLLAGRPVREAEDMAAEIRSVTRDEVVAAAGQAYDAGLLMTPGSMRGDWAGYTAAPTTSERAVEGVARQVTHASERSLVSGAEGVSAIGGDEVLTVRYDACGVVLAWPDGGRRLVGHDGIIVSVEPTLHRDGAALIAEIDARVPRNLRVDLPARHPDDIPQPQRVPRSARWRRRFAWWHSLRAEKARLILPSAAMLTLFTAALVAVIGLQVFQHRLRPLAMVTVVFLGVAAFRYAHRLSVIVRALRS